MILWGSKLNNLKSLREKKGLTQVELAYKADITSRHIQKLEAGQCDPTLGLAYKLTFELTGYYDTREIWSYEDTNI